MTMNTQMTLKTPSRTLKKVLVAAALALTGLVAVGCATAPGGNVYSSRDVGAPTRIKMGTLMDAEPVLIQGDNNRIGAASGAVIGGVVGSQVGGGKDERAVGAVAGAVLGGVLGNATEKQVKKQQGYRYTIDLDGEGLVTVVQADKQPIARPGSRVRVEYGAVVKVLPSY
jgi:outer membrane lipoprotein SlyB